LDINWLLSKSLRHWRDGAVEPGREELLATIRTGIDLHPSYGREGRIRGSLFAVMERLAHSSSKRPYNRIRWYPTCRLAFRRTGMQSICRRIENSGIDLITPWKYLQFVEHVVAYN
jgi:hypothetical protein